MRKKVLLYITLAVMVFCSGSLGAVFGYYQGTGELPFLQPVAILPEVTNSTTTLVDVKGFLERDKTSEIDYGDNFNCVEFALLVARNAHWSGLPADPARLLFQDGSSHMILVFPTKDEGWIFVDPQNDLVIHPRIGSIYSGKRIVEIDTLRCRWIPFEVTE